MKRIMTGMALLLASVLASAASVEISNPIAVTGLANNPANFVSFDTTDTSAEAVFTGLAFNQPFSVELDVITSATGTLSFDIATTVFNWSVSMVNAANLGDPSLLASWSNGSLIGGFTGLTAEVEAGAVYKLIVFGDRSLDANFGRDITVSLSNIELSEVPIPAAVWLFGSVLLGGLVLRRKNRLAQVV